jgi:hypothetical protein
MLRIARAGGHKFAIRISERPLAELVPTKSTDRAFLRIIAKINRVR